MGAYTQKFLVLALVGGVAACSSAPPGEDIGDGTAALSASDKTAYAFFLGKGLKGFQAAGIVGNLDQESSMNPDSVQYGGGPGRGIAQWSEGGRWNSDHDDNVLSYAAGKGDSATSLTLQLDFIWYELTTFSGYGLGRLRSSTNVTDATIAFQTDFEGCGQCDQSNRIAYAEAALSAYGSMTMPTPPASCKGGTQAVTRAMDWVNAELHYCQSSHDQPDPDDSCWGWEGSSHRCDRQSNAAWNAYRSDCSGLVTWAWGLPPVGDGGYVTSEFAPANNSFSKVIPAESLQPGDAINWNDGNEGHIMLFKQWVHAGTEAIFIQEPGCSAYPYHATETTADVTINGPSIRVPSVIDGAVFTAIRYNGNACDASSGTGSSGGGGGTNGTSCYSDTLGHTVGNNACVLSSSDHELWECDAGTWELLANDGAPCSATYNGTEGMTNGKECHSDTLRREVADNACVQSDINSDWYQCANGNWLDRWTDPTACNGVYPLEGSANDGAHCYSDTLGRDVSDNACVQSASNDDWYQCANGSWTDRWTDPAACNGVYPR
jgi:hypothetical protein